MAAAGIGHNGGPSMEAGASWRRHCWTAARAALLPTLPVEVVRLRVKRAAQLGLDYRTYAAVRAAGGRDVLAFLFSSNALRVTLPAPHLDGTRAARLAAIRDCGRLALAVAPLTPARLEMAARGAIDAASPAPAHLARFADQAGAIRAAIGRLPRDGVVLVGDGALEEDWCAAGRLAAYLPAERYFGP
ncbi:MAG: hypothetical protein RIR62_2075 [Pseudomonadota bacterium]